MTYTETLDYLYQNLPMYHRVGAAAFKKDLTNTRALCTALGNPQDTFPSIHVGGTNGKGSTSHMIAAILQSLGLKVGLYVSPHYRDFRERIKINGQYIAEQDVINFVETHKTLFEEVKPSFFEMTVAMAFDYFAVQKVDIAVIEVGLGGRLDSTNVLSPLVSVITNISFDHTDMLGNTLPLIAFEKAGIIKPHTPVVIGEEHVETLPVFQEKALEVKAPIVVASQNVDIHVITHSNFNVCFDVFINDALTYKNITLDVGGDYQVHNVKTTLQTVDILKKLPFFEPYTEGVWQTAVKDGLAHLTTKTNFIGRWHLLNKQPLIICDSAHNESGIKLAMKQLNSLIFNELHMVIGFVKDKDIGKILTLMPQNATYYFAKADIPRGLEAEILRGLAHDNHLQGQAYESVSKALEAAKHNAKKNDVIYVGGSIFVIAEVI